jgi:hypothetical protein
MNNKFNIDDKVRFETFECKVTDVNYRDVSYTTNRMPRREYLYDLTTRVRGEVIVINGVLEYNLELIEQNTIEEDTQEGETQDEISLPESPYIYEDGVLRYNESTSIYLCPICNEEIKYNFYGSEFGFICEECNDKKIPQTTTTIDSIPNVKDSGSVLHSYPQEHIGMSIGSSVGQAPVGLDYEKEYNNSIGEHEETKRLLANAKDAIKHLSELI